MSVDDLVETSLNRQGLLDALDKASARVLLPDEFLRDPEGHLDKIENPRGIRRLTPLRVGFVSLSGGVGCSTLAYDLARSAVTRHETTVALIELTWGDGALGARLDLDGAPDLYQVVQDMRPPAQHEGITVVPIRQRTVRLLLGDRARVTSALEPWPKSTSWSSSMPTGLTLFGPPLERPSTNTWWSPTSDPMPSGTPS